MLCSIGERLTGLLRLILVVVLVFGIYSMTLKAQESEPDSDQRNRLLLPLVGNPDSSLQTVLMRQALVIAAARTGRALGTLSIAHSAIANFDLTNQNIHRFKVIDPTGDIVGVSLTEAGREVDVEQLVAAEDAAHTAIYGRLNPALATAITAANDQPLSVILWLRTAAYEGPARPEPKDFATAALTDTETAAESRASSSAAPGDEETTIVADQPAAPVPLDGATVQRQAEIDRLFAEVDAVRAAFVAEATTPIVRRIRSLGFDARADLYAPAVYAKLNAPVLAEAANWDEVLEIHLEQTSEPQLDIARQVIRANTVNDLGMTGSGIRVAQIEVGGRINTDNPYLAGVVQDTTFVCLAAHAAAVAGDIRSTHPTVRGVAPGVTLWAGGSCQGFNSQLEDRTTAAINWGARAINLSLGANTSGFLTSFDRFYDNLVINQFRVVVVAAGNYGASGCPQGSDGFVGSPANAYNVIAVGNYNDFNTVTPAGDAMNPCSSWRNPASTNNDREKPEVSAPGTNINSTINVEPWIGDTGSGTSYSAPMVTGGVALLYQRNADLIPWPEAIKAILMATALQNIEGAARLSQFDGAGGVQLDQADNVARGVAGAWGGQDYNCATVSPLTIATVTLAAGRRFRSAVVWDTDPNYDAYGVRPSADLDLRILNAAGVVVAVSSSYDNTYEIVDFAPSAAGAYRLQVTRFRCNVSPRWLGWAWTQP
jgi:hypothetical protein